MRRCALAIVLIWLVVIGSAPFIHGATPAPSEVPAVATPRWAKFEIFVWQYQTKVLSDHELYRSVGLRAFHIDRNDPRAKAFAEESDRPYYVDHLADKGYLHLGNKLDEQILRKKELIERPVSLADPATLDKVKQIMRKNVTANRGSHAAAYALDDEVSLGSFVAPSEVDASPAGVRVYREWLQREYGTIDALNRRYGTKYAAFADVAPKSFEAFRGQLVSGKLDKVNLSAWCDWRSAMDSHFADTLEELARDANTLDPKTPVGIVGGQMPSPWGGYDYRKLSRALQWIEAYDIGSTNEILRSYWDQSLPRTQTFFSSKNPKQDAWFLWYYLCHGNRGVIAWPEGWFADGKVAQHIQDDTATFTEVQGPIGRHILDGRFVHDPIALYDSHPSVQVGWALDAATHGGTWPRRSSSMDNALSTASHVRTGWLKTLEDLGYQAKFIHRDHLLADALTKEGYKVLILGRTLCLSDEEADAIRAFAKAGGTVIADHQCGLFDLHGQARPRGALDDLFGTTRDTSRGWFDGKSLTEVDGERGSLDNKTWLGNQSPRFDEMAVVELGLSADGAVTGAKANEIPVLLRKDRAAYLNLSPIGYLMQRRGSGGAAWSKRIAGLLTEAGLKPRVVVTRDGTPDPLVERLFWSANGRETLCLVQNLDRSAKIDGFGAVKTSWNSGPQTIRLTFARPVKDLINERTGKRLGAGTTFEDRFTPWEANVYTYRAE